MTYHKRNIFLIQAAVQCRVPAGQQASLRWFENSILSLAHFLRPQSPINPARRWEKAQPLLTSLACEWYLRLSSWQEPVTMPVWLDSHFPVQISFLEEQRQVDSPLATVVSSGPQYSQAPSSRTCIYSVPPWGSPRTASSPEHGNSE